VVKCGNQWWGKVGENVKSDYPLPNPPLTF
jgi:hypothetical protein